MPNTDREWRPMESAPTDGTVVELRCTYGIMPWYALYRWATPEWGGQARWTDARDPFKSVDAQTGGRHLAWRPFSGDLAAYTDPTNGAQETNEYWLRGINPRTRFG